MKLYEIAEEILHLANAAYDATDEEFAAIQEQYIEVKKLAVDKLESIGRLMRDMELDADKLKAEESRLSQRRKSLETRREWLRLYVGRCIGEGVAVKTDSFSFSWRKSSAVEITDEAAIPPAYIREKVIIEPDKKQIATDLKAGATIPGAVMIERLNLQVK